jgi:hypothetical protein
VPPVASAEFVKSIMIKHQIKDSTGVPFVDPIKGVDTLCNLFGSASIKFPLVCGLREIQHLMRYKHNFSIDDGILHSRTS